MKHRDTQYQSFCRSVLLLALVTAIIFGWIGYARADNLVKSRKSATPLTSLLPLSGASQPVYRITASLQGNQPVRLTGALQTTAEWLGSLQAQVMHCWTETVGDRYSVWTTTNHLGQENGAADDTVVTTTGEWLFTPPQTAIYVCTLYGRAGRNPYPADWPLEYLTVVGGNITIDPTPRTLGMEWRQPDIQKVGGENGVYKWVLVKRWNSPLNTDIRIHSATQLTSISIGQSSVATADVTTYVTQLTDTGLKCSRYTTQTRVSVSGKLHHLKTQHTITIPYNPNCSPTFAIQTELRYVSGQGMQVEGPSYSSAYLYPIGS